MIQKHSGGKAAIAMPVASSTCPSSCWILTDGKVGDEAQCIGVAMAVGAPYEIRRVAPKPPFSWFMPRGPIDPRELPTRSGSPIEGLFPDLVIGSGRRAIPYLRYIKRVSRHQSFTVCLKDPRTGTSAADLIWVPEHDALRGENVLVSVTAPHRFSAEDLEAARNASHPQIDGFAPPRIAVLVGGDSRHHKFEPSDIQHFMAGLERLVQASAAHLMITTSRRTPSELTDRLTHFAAGGRHLLWDGQSENPLVSFLAKADAVVASADSTNMIGEAAATGKPIHVFHPTGGHAKIDRFLGTLDEMGIIHPFPGPLKTTTYKPLNSTPMIAGEILRAFARRRTD